MSRVYIFIWHYLPLRVTSNIRIKAFSEALAKDFDEVIIVARQWEDEDNYANKYYAETSNNSIKSIGENNIKIIHLPDNGRISLKLARSLQSFIILKKLYFYLYFILYKREVANNFFEVFKLHEHEIMKDSGFDTFVICSAPVFNSLSIGHYLKINYGYKWVADYRDPWNFDRTNLYPDSFISRVKKTLIKSKEGIYLKSANGISVVANHIKKSLPAEFHVKTTLVFNGVDSDIDTNRINKFPNKFRIVYSGKLYKSQLKAELFFISLKKFIDKNNIKPENLELVFIGSIANIDLIKIIEKYKLEEFVKCIEWVEKSIAYQFMYEASCFLYLPFYNQSEIVSTKQYTYLGMRKPILLPSTINCEISEDSNKFESWRVLFTIDEVYNEIHKLYFNFVNKVPAIIFTSNYDQISMKNSAEKFREFVSKIRYEC